MVSSISTSISPVASGRFNRPFTFTEKVNSNNSKKSDSNISHTNNVFNESVSSRAFYAQVDRSEWSHHNRFALENYQSINDQFSEIIDSSSVLLPRIDCRV